MRKKEKKKTERNYSKFELDFNKERSLTPYKEILKMKKNIKKKK